MAEISIGRLQLVSSGGRLKVSAAEGFEQPVELESEDVSELLAFLVSLSATEFNQRQSFRIPLWYAISLCVTLSQGNVSIEVSPVNISMTGMLVDLPEDHALEIEEGAYVDVRLEFEGESTQFPVRIERENGLRWALSLSGQTNNDETDPFPEYSEIVMAIQRRWAARFRDA